MFLYCKLFKKNGKDTKRWQSLGKTKNKVDEATKIKNLSREGKYENERGFVIS